MPRLVEAQAQALQLEQPLGALLDGLEVEDVGAGQVAPGAVDLVVAEGPVVHGPDLLGDRRDHAVGLVGHRPGVDAEEARQEVGRVGDAAADAVDQAQLVADDPAQPVGESRAGAEDVVEHDQGLEVGMMAGDAEMAEDDVDLLAGMLHPADSRLARLSRAGHRDGSLAPGAHEPKWALTSRASVLGSKSPTATRNALSGAKCRR